MLDLTQPALEVAPHLLGAIVRHGRVAVRLTEVEAYEGVGDPAAHAVGGPRPHTQDLFGDPGTLYLYLSHGLHICGNIVCGVPGGGSAVLLRGGDVIDGLDLARQRRPGATDAALARGPGCLGRTMGWRLEDSGRRFGQGDLDLIPPVLGPTQIASGPRVGVSVGHRRPWRFWVVDALSVSAYRRSPRVVPGGQEW